MRGVAATSLELDALDMDYSAIAEGALLAIRDAGTKFSATRLTKVVDPGTDTETVTPLTGEFDAVLLPAKSNLFATSTDTAEVEALRTGRASRLLVAASSAPFPPLVGDIFAIDSGSHRVDGVTALKPNGTIPIIYTLKLTWQ